MTIKFDIDKFVKYLDRYKSDLSTLYNWNAKIDKHGGFNDDICYGEKRIDLSVRCIRD
jgi:hypothetical protein